LPRPVNLGRRSPGPPAPAQAGTRGAITPPAPALVFHISVSLPVNALSHSRGPMIVRASGLHSESHAVVGTTPWPLPQLAPRTRLEIWCTTYLLTVSCIRLSPESCYLRERFRCCRRSFSSRPCCRHLERISSSCSLPSSSVSSSSSSARGGGACGGRCVCCARCGSGSGNDTAAVAAVARGGA